MSSAPRSPAELAASYIEDHAEQIVARWIEWVESTTCSTAQTALPDCALRNHVPPVLLSLARYVRSPVEFARADLFGHLQLHGRIRTDQGYSLQEVLAEFDGLADLVTRGVNQTLLKGAAHATAEEFMDATSRLATGLRTIAFVAVGSFREADEDRARDLAGTLEEFTRAVVHEIRNPLNSLALNLELLRDELPDDFDIPQHATGMLTSVDRINCMVDSIQTLAIAEGALSGPRLVALKEVVVRTTEELSHEAATQNVALRIEEPLPEVQVEAALVYIVCANLIGNAIKYHDPNKAERTVEISAKFLPESRDSGFCELAVADNGVGIPEELLPRIQQRGFRGHPEIAHGSGLGLFIVQQAIHGRGGELRFESEVDVGTTVRARFRCLESSAPSIAGEDFCIETLLGKKTVDLGDRRTLPEPPGHERDG